MPDVVQIDDPSDPRIAPYRDVRERDLVGREGLFVAEGEVVLRVLLGESRFEPLSLLIAEKRIESLKPLIVTVPATIPVFSAAQEVMDGIVGFHIHRGVLALGRRSPMPTADALLAGAGGRILIVVLFAIANHDNMGGVFRNAAAFGADAVILDSQCVDPLYRKAIRVSVGATLTVPFARLNDSDDALELLARHGIEPIALSPKGTLSLADLASPDRVAVLLGSEGDGLPSEVLARARSVRIPMAKGVDSLNVATASGIVLNHLRFGGGSV